MKLKQLPLITSGMVLLLLLLFPAAAFSDAQNLETSQYEWGPFDQSYYNTFAVIKPATISNEALQITPDSAGNFTLANRSGRVFFTILSCSGPIRILLAPPQPEPRDAWRLSIRRSSLTSFVSTAPLSPERAWPSSSHRISPSLKAATVNTSV
ncbi:unnamed protein product [Prunus armeniaca]|uniref:Uncharacterized protein n=1 Tax=Prunus armeniaca TaxID=36596 RepID=A0A6J5XWX4_PRUAR|nr:unnamed protein product [Prunus armeniaca]